MVKEHNRKCINDINLLNYDLEVFNIFRDLLDFNDKKIPRRSSQICLPPTSNGIKCKITPMTGAISKFKYNVAKDESHCDPLNMLLLGLDSNIVSFSNLLSKVDIKSKTRFQEQTLGYKRKRTHR